MATDYSATIKQKRAADPLANVDQDLLDRYAKVQADPTLLAKYGNDSYSAEAQKILAARNKITPQDNSANINSMYDAQLAAETASLNAARDKTNSDYQSQIDSAPQTFQPQRDSVDVSTARNIQRANEVAAAKGTTFTGGVASDQGAMVSSGEGQKTALTQQEINLVQNLKKAIADNNSATSLKQIELNATTMAQKNQAQIDESNRLYSTRYQQSQDSFNNGIAAAGVTGNYNGNRTLAGQQQDLAIQNSNTSASQWLKSFDYQKERDKVADGQWLKTFTQNVNDANASRAVQWGNLSLNRDQLAWSKDPTNPDNVYKVAQAAANGNKQFEDLFSKAWDMMSATNKTYDPATGQYVENPAYTQEDVGKLIDNSSLDDPEALRLRRMLGIPDPK